MSTKIPRTPENGAVVGGRVSQAKDGEDEIGRQAAEMMNI